MSPGNPEINPLGRKGILLAGGSNTRLFPTTLAVPKTLLPVYDKPLAYYALATLMLAGISEIVVIAAAGKSADFRRLLGDGSRFGIRVDYLEQAQPRGIAQAMVLAREFLAGAPSALALGDNIYYGSGMPIALASACARQEGATVFASRVADPERFGIVELGSGSAIVSLEEKPQKPKSNLAVTGLYFYDCEAPAMAEQLKPSGRGELEITDLNRMYLERGKLRCELLGRGTAWFDTGNPESLSEAAEFVRAVQNRQGVMICCPEEIAWRNGWLASDALAAAAGQLANTEYASYLRALAKE